VPEGERSRPFICPPSAILPPNKLFRALSPKKDSTKLLPLDNIAMTPDQNPLTALSLQKMDNHAWHITGSRDCSKRHKQNLHVKKSGPFASKTLQKHMHTYIHTWHITGTKDWSNRHTNKTSTSRQVILSTRKHYRSTYIHTYYTHHKEKKNIRTSERVALCR
jgi:hypothetical protein